MGDLLIRTVAARETGLRVEDLAFSEDEHGKPFLTNVESFRFNVAHSGSWVVCTTDDRPVGIDVERIGPFDEDVARSCLTPEELRLVLAEPAGPVQTGRRFFELWTLKESYVKALGTGLAFGLDSFRIVGFPDGVSRVAIGGRVQRDVFLRGYPTDENHAMSVCARHGDFPETAIELDGLDIIDGIRAGARDGAT
jgi:4'-phosphopantetheinyl transferase